jgi:hypothetical protein
LARRGRALRLCGCVDVLGSRSGGLGVTQKALFRGRTA